jgi:hypothetical protein
MTNYLRNYLFVIDFKSTINEVPFLYNPLEIKNIAGKLGSTK